MVTFRALLTATALQTVGALEVRTSFPKSAAKKPLLDTGGKGDPGASASSASAPTAVQKKGRPSALRGILKSFLATLSTNICTQWKKIPECCRGCMVFVVLFYPCVLLFYFTCYFLAVPSGIAVFKGVTAPLRVLSYEFGPACWGSIYNRGESSEGVGAQLLRLVNCEAAGGYPQPADGAMFERCVNEYGHVPVLLDGPRPADQSAAANHSAAARTLFRLIGRERGRGCTHGFVTLSSLVSFRPRSHL